MIRIAVVEDEKKNSDELVGYIRRYGKERGENYNVLTYFNGIDFLSSAEPFHIVFFDIDMPLMGGMEAAKKLRESDNSACIIFVTHLAQYAVRGYEVDASAFIVKPVSYQDFVPKFEKALGVASAAKTYSVLLPLKAGYRRLAVDQIIYVEVTGHQLTFHLKDNSITQRMPLSKVREMLGSDFFQCNKCYLVNLAYVTEINADTVVAGGYRLELSRLKKKGLLNAVAEYFGRLQ